MYNDLRGLVFDCSTGPDGSCSCSYPSSLIAQGRCQLAGDDVLNVSAYAFGWNNASHWESSQALGIGGISFPLYVAILLIITLVYRILLYVVLVFKKR